jgi:hypothetical protein
MDKLIYYVNKDGRVNAFYSIPSIYTEGKYTFNESWPLKTDDFSCLQIIQMFIGQGISSIDLL